MKQLADIRGFRNRMVFDDDKDSPFMFFHIQSLSCILLFLMEFLAGEPGHVTKKFTSFLGRQIYWCIENQKKRYWYKTFQICLLYLFVTLPDLNIHQENTFMAIWRICKLKDQLQKSFYTMEKNLGTILQTSVCWCPDQEEKTQEKECVSM